MSSFKLHPVLLERFSPTFDILLDPKWSKTVQGWPVEQVRGGSLPCLLASSGWYASRVARSHLIPNNQNAALDAEFSVLFWSTVSTFATAEGLYAALQDCLDKMDELDFEKYRSATLQLVDAFSVAYEIPLPNSESPVASPIGYFSVDQQGILLQCGFALLEGILNRYEKENLPGLEGKHTGNNFDPLWRRYQRLSAILSNDEVDAFELLYHRLKLARLYVNASSSIGLTTQSTLITDLHARALAYLRLYRQECKGNPPNHVSLTNLQQHLHSSPPNFPSVLTAAAVPNTTSSAPSNTASNLFSLPPIPPPITDFYVMNRTFLPAPGGPIGTLDYFTTPFDAPRPHLKPKPPVPNASNANTANAPNGLSNGLSNGSPAATSSNTLPPDSMIQSLQTAQSREIPSSRQDRPFYKENPPSSSVLMHPNPVPTFYTIWHPSVWSLAVQLTLLHSSLFVAIPMHEWMACEWDAPSYQHGADAIQFFIHVYNATALWVSSDILVQRTTEAQAAAIARSIQLAACLQHMHNFSAISAIITGLTRDSITRLTKAWVLLPSGALDWFRGVQKLMNDEQQYRVYKEAFKGVTNVNAPMVPHLGAHLAELSAMEMNLEKELPVPASKNSGPVNGDSNVKHDAPKPPKLINMRRYRMLHASVQPLIAAQLRSYFKPVDVATSSASLLSRFGSSAKTTDSGTNASQPVLAPPLSLSQCFSIDPNHWRVILDTLRPFHYVSEDERDFATEKLLQRSRNIQPDVVVVPPPHFGLLDPTEMMQRGSPTRRRSRSPRQWISDVLGRK